MAEVSIEASTPQQTTILPCHSTLNIVQKLVY